MLIPPNGKPRTVKDHIISILSQQWPLSARKLYNMIKKDNSVTYQAVHKTLKELVRQGIIVKEGKDYQLNLEWIESIATFGHKLKDSYNNINKIPSIERIFSEEHISFSFSTIYELYAFIINVLDYAEKNKIKDITATAFHPWNPMLADEMQLNIVKNCINKVNFYGIGKYSMPIDRALKNILEEMGSKIKIKLGVSDCASNCETMIVKDHIFHFYYPKEILQSIDSVYSKIFSLKDMKFDELHRRFFFKKTNINVIVDKNLSLAEQLRKETLGYFKCNRQN